MLWPEEKLLLQGMYKNREIFLPSVAQSDNELLLFAGI